MLSEGSVVKINNNHYTIIKSPIGHIVPIWTTEPQFYLLRLYIAPPNRPISDLLRQLNFVDLSPKIDSTDTLENLFDNHLGFIKSTHPHIKQLEKSLELYFSSKTNIDFPANLLYLEKLTEFAQKILLTLKKTAIGQTLTYGQLAKLTGHPKAYRAAGSVMNNNPFPLIIPCHRVIRSNGIGEFALGKGMKKTLLQHENPINKLNQLR